MAMRNWPLASVVANTNTDWVVPGVNHAAAIFGLIVCNTGTVDTADVTVTLTSADGTVLATPIMTSLNPGESVHVDTKIFIAASTMPEKLRALSTVAAVSFLASGDEV